MKPGWSVCLKVGVTLFALFLCIHYWAALSGFLLLALRAAAPVFLGCAAAFVLNIPMTAYERRYFPNSGKPIVTRTRRPVCLFLAVLSVLVLLALLLWLVVPELVECIGLLASRVPGALEQLTDATAGLDWLDPRVAQYLNELDWQALIDRVCQAALAGIGNVANLAAGVIASVISGAVTVLMALIFAVYVLLSKERLARQFKLLAKRYLKKSWRGGVRRVAGVLQDCFHAYIVGQCTEAVILGGLCAGGMLLLGFPYAAVVGATVGFTALIPVAGAYIGGGVGFLLILTVSPMQALLFVLYLVILQQLENNLIYPKVVGTSLALPGIWVLAAVIIGGGVWGVGGMVIGVPLAAAVYRLLKEDVKKPCREQLSET